MRRNFSMLFHDRGTLIEARLCILSLRFFFSPTRDTLSRLESGPYKIHYYCYCYYYGYFVARDLRKFVRLQTVCLVRNDMWCSDEVINLWVTMHFCYSLSLVWKYALQEPFPSQCPPTPPLSLHQHSHINVVFVSWTRVSAKCSTRREREYFSGVSTNSQTYPSARLFRELLRTLNEFPSTRNRDNTCSIDQSYLLQYLEKAFNTNCGEIVW